MTQLFQKTFLENIFIEQKVFIYVKLHRYSSWVIIFFKYIIEVMICIFLTVNIFLYFKKFMNKKCYSRQSRINDIVNNLLVKCFSPFLMPPSFWVYNYFFSNLIMFKYLFRKKRLIFFCFQIFRSSIKLPFLEGFILLFIKKRCWKIY